ncbi:RHS repeat-associated core domain-containing protein, partial [Streptomyces sp. SID10815]|uniref:RHS repeat-associated core domain-containing protein n=1 Tax=Streptomyces sp. SID10815 TaxID=2706027 RepID=UPI0013C78AB9
TTGPWSYDPIGNESAGSSTDEYLRTNEMWTDHSQMSSITVNNKTYAGQYGSTDQSERVKLGDTLFHNGPLGLSAKTTGGVDMGFNREPGGTLNSMTTGGQSYYYLTDAIGSVIGLVDVDGNKVDTYTYSPRGVRLLAQSSEPVAQPYRFAGNYQDPTGLYHLQNRYYDANIGRFTQPDPSGQEQNPYLYAEGDPVNKIDPSGLSFMSSVGDFLDSANDPWGAVVGCIGGIGAAAESGLVEAASVAGPWGTAAAVTGGCVVGGVLGYNNADIISYG